MREVRRLEDWRESVSYEELQVQCIADCSEVMVGTSKDKLEVCRVFVEGPKGYVPTVQRAEVSTEHKAGWIALELGVQPQQELTKCTVQLEGGCNWRMQRDRPGRRSTATEVNLCCNRGNRNCTGALVICLVEWSKHVEVGSCSMR